MRITKLELNNFKRFTQLAIDRIPGTAKLVLVIGSNGSGKSSVFDALDFLGMAVKGRIGSREYYGKNGAQPDVAVRLADGGTVSASEKEISTQNFRYSPESKFIGRSSIRIVPRIRNAGNVDTVKNDGDKPQTFIDADTRFDNDLMMFMQQIDNAIREPVFSGKSADTLKIFQENIAPFNNSLLNILGGDSLTTIQLAEFQNPTSNSSGKLIFRKGESRINYDLLSHGEKQIVILLLNFIVRREYYKDSIIFIDEMDCHLNTAIQSNLLAEIVNTWIPDDAQLWTASHALGFIDFAKSADNAAILDLDLLNFDIPQIIVPQPKENMQVYDIAIPKDIIKNILRGSTLVVVENKNDQFYNLALGEKGYLFLPAQNNREVFLTVKQDPSKRGLRDRDYLKPEEVTEIKSRFPGMRILDYYTFENYVYHPDNLVELARAGFNRDAYISELIAQKNAALISIVSGIATARQTYVEFKEGIRNDNNIDVILNALQSDDFNTFYPYFNMKSHYNKAYLQNFNFNNHQELVKTKWFTESILALLA